MYWAVKPDGAYEVVDGKQRTIPICLYLQGDFSVGGKYFCNQPDDVRAAIEDYELTVYFCEGTESEKLDWFRVINIAGERLEQQELRNASYVGPWEVDAKKYFSSEKGMAYLKWRDYLTGECKRQKWLETVIGWIAGDDSVGRRLTICRCSARRAISRRVRSCKAKDRCDGCQTDVGGRISKVL